jgi:hypothetical protein
MDKCMSCYFYGAGLVTARVGYYKARLPHVLSLLHALLAFPFLLGADTAQGPDQIQLPRLGSPSFQNHELKRTSILYKLPNLSIPL